jgi:hypothetical protein
MKVWTPGIEPGAAVRIVGKLKPKPDKRDWK